MNEDKWTTEAEREMEAEISQLKAQLEVNAITSRITQQERDRAKELNRKANQVLAQILLNPGKHYITRQIMWWRGDLNPDFLRTLAEKPPRRPTAFDTVRAVILTGRDMARSLRRLYGAKNS